MQQLKTIESFHLIGISVRTTNENNQSAKDIPALWSKFMAENIASKVPNKSSQDIYCLYTNYESNHLHPYTAFLGYRVPSGSPIPEGLTQMVVPSGSYTVFTAKGNLLQGAVWNTWTKIWATELDRRYQVDFEVYGDEAQNPESAKVDIFVGIN